MQRNVDKHGTRTKEEIRAVVKAVCNEITEETALAMDGRLHRNEKKATELKGGNFYDESTA
jgi:hypothetical protein